MNTQQKRFGPLVEADELLDELGAGDLRVFDCRFDLMRVEAGAEAYARDHIPGARYAHLDHHLSAPIRPDTGRHPLPDPQRLVGWLREQGVDCDSRVVAYDDSGGVYAVRLWWLMRWLGHTQVAVLNGGYGAWRKAGGATDSERPETTAGNFTGSPRNELVVSTADLLREMPECLLDVRTTERYTGEKEPIDPVAGHIPGAVNLPLQRNLDSDGRFLSASGLQALYRPLVPPGGASAMVCYCGSGVTACHSLLALELAGFGTARLYAGSWSEWIRDPARAVATGAGK